MISSSMKHHQSPNSKQHLYNNTTKGNRIRALKTKRKKFELKFPVIIHRICFAKIHRPEPNWIKIVVHFCNRIFSSIFQTETA